MRPDRTRQRGLTLIELMIAGTLGLVLLLALVQLFVDNNRHRRQNQQLAGLQDQGRYALASLTRDLQMAGYWGGMFQAQTVDVRASALAGLSTTADCGPADAEAGWAFDAGARVAVMPFTVLRKALLSPSGLARLSAQAAPEIARLRSVIRASRADVVLSNTVTIPWWPVAASAAGANTPDGAFVTPSPRKVLRGCHVATQEDQVP